MIACSITSPLAQEHNYIYPDYFYIPYPATTDTHDSNQQPGKRVKLEQSTVPFYPSFDASTLNLAFSGNMQQSQLQGLNAPHISLQRASSVSPMTVATPLSQHSTPSRSPPRVSVMSDSSTPDWILYDDRLSTLAHNQSKDGVPLNHHHLSTTSTQPQISLQMEATLPNSYYSGFPVDFSKLSHPQYISPFTPTYQSLSQTITHHSEDEPPALSPPHRYQSSGRPSVYDADIQSPMTPVGSPRSSDGDRMSSTRTPVTREDTYVSIYDDWMDEGLQFPFIDIHNPVSKFTRTASDAEEDELFRSSNIEAQQSRQRQNNGVTGNMPDTLATFYKKAQNDHAMEARHTVPNQLNVPRGDSPFRANSPFHPMRTSQSVSAPTRHSNFHPYMTIQARREHQKELDTQSMNDHMVAEAGQIVSTPKTISPKDAVLDYPEPDDESSKMSLFAHEHSHAPLHSYSSQEVTNDIDDRSYGLGASRRGSEAESLSSVGAFSYHQHSPQMPMLPSNFPYHPQSLESSPITAPMIGNHHYPGSSSPITKPEGSKADTGAYTCTVPGCQQRFANSLKLQKHKNQNHRQSTPIGPAGMTSTLRGNLSSRHQGPHRCTMINPQNGKPCNTVFSRPYDLTRHEDTIHNTTREKARCEICNDEKTFSRQDALTRHKKVKHGIDK